MASSVRLIASMCGRIMAVAFLFAVPVVRLVEPSVGRFYPAETSPVGGQRRSRRRSRAAQFSARTGSLHRVQFWPAARASSAARAGWGVSLSGKLPVRAATRCAPFVPCARLELRRPECDVTDPREISVVGVAPDALAT